MRLIAIGLAAMTLAGCGGVSTSEPGVYPVALATAYQRLVDGNWDDFRLVRQCGVLIHFVSDGVPGTAASPSSTINFTVVSAGSNVLTFSAQLVPVDAANTRVKVDIERDGDGKELYSGAQFYRHPALRQPTRTAIEEKVGALIEGRPFTIDRVAQPRGQSDTVCNVQRGTLEATGKPFSVHDGD